MSPFVSYFADTSVALEVAVGAGQPVIVDDLEEWIERMSQTLTVSLQDAFSKTVR